MLDSLQTLRSFNVSNITYHYFSIQDAAEKLGFSIKLLPYSLKVLLENLLRHEDGETVTIDDIKTLANYTKVQPINHEVNYRPARVLMQDFTGVPAIVDLAAMRDAMQKLGQDPEKINPIVPVDLVVDHSIQVDMFASPDAAKINNQLEMQRNQERYAFLRWGQQAFDNFRVVPPSTGICHQVNLEFLAKVVWSGKVNNKLFAYPDTVIGTDSHTTMINSLGILGWGVGGIEAEAAMLGQAVSMLIPRVIGVYLEGMLCEGVTATDAVLTITELLRTKGVVGCFVEYYGPGLQYLSVADRATLANMAPEYGATCGFFPVDQLTLDYLELTGRDRNTIELVKIYSKLQGLWYDQDVPDPQFSEVVSVDLSTIEPCVSGPKRPQDRLNLSQLKNVTSNLTNAEYSCVTPSGHQLFHNAVVIASITSCTNTSNPSVMVAAGLVAKKAVAKGMKVKPWVKTSLAPGSQVVTRYLEHTGLQAFLNEIGFFVVGYGCTTCIGNSGPLPEDIASTIKQHNLTVAAVLSGNRNFEGRIHPQIKTNWLASPPLVVIFALAGTTNIDLTQDPVGVDSNGKAVFLQDLWPSNQEIAEEIAKISRNFFQEQYANVFSGDQEWQDIASVPSKIYEWQDQSTYIQRPPYFVNMQTHNKITNFLSSRILAIFGDSITTDHISPAGSIHPDSPAGKYLLEQGVTIKEFNSYGARRGNHQVMMRGTFANIRIKNEILPNVEGGFTKYFPHNKEMSIYDAAMLYVQDKVNLVVIAGKEYGSGSSRDWAAKGPMLLGVKAVIAESFERIHRSNLIGMGIVPLQFLPGINRHTLKLVGTEVIDILFNEDTKPGEEVQVIIHYDHGATQQITVLSRIDTYNEISYYLNGGILQYVLNNKFANSDNIV